MDIGAIDMSGTMASVPVAFNPPREISGSVRGGQGTDGAGTAIGRAQLHQMVEEMQRHLDSMNVSLQYSFYGSGGEKVAVKVVNKETGEIIREIPSREMQVLQSKMSELVGMIFNDNA